MRRRLGQLPGRRKAGNYKRLTARTKSEGREIEAVSLDEELGDFHLSGGGGYETVDEEAGDILRLRGEEGDSFADLMMLQAQRVISDVAPGPCQIYVTSSLTSLRTASWRIIGLCSRHSKSMALISSATLTCRPWPNTGCRWTWLYVSTSILRFLGQRYPIPSYPPKCQNYLGIVNSNLAVTELN